MCGKCVSTTLHWPIPRRDLTVCWTLDCTSPRSGPRIHRAEKNYIPDEVAFKTKPQIALDLIDRAKANGIEVLAWTADELYGRDGAFLDGLDERGEAFVVEIPPNSHVWLTKPMVLKKGGRERKCLAYEGVSQIDADLLLTLLNT